MKYDDAKKKLLNAIPKGGFLSIYKLWNRYTYDFPGETFWVAFQELEDERKIKVRRYKDTVSCKRL